MMQRGSHISNNHPWLSDDSIDDADNFVCGLNHHRGSYRAHYGLQLSLKVDGEDIEFLKGTALVIGLPIDTEPCADIPSCQWRFQNEFEIKNDFSLPFADKQTLDHAAVAFRKNSVGENTSEAAIVFDPKSLALDNSDPKLPRLHFSDQIWHLQQKGEGFLDFAISQIVCKRYSNQQKMKTANKTEYFLGPHANFTNAGRLEEDAEITLTGWRTLHFSEFTQDGKTFWVNSRRLLPL